MDLSTTYLGWKLPHPFMPGAGPLAHNLDAARRLEDAGTAAIVLHSLFEEQITREQISTFFRTESHGESFAEARFYFPSPARFPLGPEEYLEHIARVKAAVKCPVIASLNGTTPGGWLEYAKAMGQAGADALELNVYAVPSDLEEPSPALETRTVEMVKEIKSQVRVPVAVKLSPFYTALPHFAKQLETIGADGLVLFNRFYQPDIDPETLEASRQLTYSTSAELHLRLRWIAMLSGRVKPSLAATGGVHTALDAIKAIMSGAHAVQMVSVLMHEGPQGLKRIREQVETWMEEHEYESVEQMRGSMNLMACPDPTVYERANYMLILQSWRQMSGLSI